jgi:uncharacterized protein YbjT (DUF2867 family)
MAGKILVLGATGTVGSELVTALAMKGEQVNAATRKVEAQPERDGVRYLAFDHKNAKLFRPVLEGVDRIFVMAPPGYAAPDQLLAPFLDTALSRVKRVVTMTAAGVDANDAIPLRKVERTIERSGVSWTHLRPNWFMQNFHKVWIGSIQATGNIAVPAADSKSAFIDARDIAACAATALTTDGHTGKAYTLSGGEALTYAEAAAILTRETGRKIGYMPIDDESFRAALLRSAMPEDYARTMVGLFQNVRTGYAARVSGDVKMILGAAPRTLVDYARTYKDAFTAAWR